MKITIAQTFFANRTFVYNIPYNEAVNLFRNVSEKKESETNSKYINDIANNFFSKNEFSFSKKSSRSFDSTKQRLLNSDYSIFTIEHKKLKEEFDSLICDPIHRLFSNGGILLELKKLRKEIKHSILLEDNNKDLLFWNALYNDVDLLISESANYSKKDETNCFDYYKLVKTKNNIWKNDVSLHPVYANSRILNRLSDLDKRIHDLEDYFTVKNIFSSSIIKCIIALSKAGFISVSFAVEYIGESGHLEVNQIESVNDVINEAIDKATTINSRINSVPKLFSFIDINHLLGLKKMLIVDNLAENYNFYEEKNHLIEDEKRSRKEASVFNNNFATYKCTHLRFTVDDIGNDSKLPMYFYDYVSLLASYNYSFDSYYLWNVVTKNFSELEKNDNIVDYIGKATEHMYIDESSVLISVINPISPNNLLKKLAGVELPNSSHQLRIYSFWRFMYACNALAFGGISIVSSYILDAVSVNYVPYLYNKIKMVYLYHKYSYLSSYICSLFDLRHFYAKSSNMMIANAIFTKLNISDVVDARRAKSEELWRNANLSNTQLYNRYGLLFTIISLTITVISYGLVSAVFQSEQKAKNPVDFFLITFTSPKFYFILLIATIPVILCVFINLFIVFKRKRDFSVIKESKIFNRFASSNFIPLRHKVEKKVEKHKKTLTFKRIIARIKAIRK